MRPHLPMALLLVLLPVLAAAQHPCDLQTATSYRPRPSAIPTLRLGFCFTPTSSDQIGFRVHLNNDVVDLGWLTPVPLLGPNAAGAWYYESPAPSLTSGTLTITAYSASGESPPSAPIRIRIRRW